MAATYAKEKIIRRLERPPVPPAYRDTVFAINPRAHIQAVGRDAAGRLQYRYHPEWERIRELRKARRLAKLIDLMPAIRRSITKLLKQTEIDREFAAAALVNLIACTAIRPGSETYVRERGTRGAATLLKSHVKTRGGEITLRFPGKGGKHVEKVCRSKRLVKTLRKLQKLPGNRVFQYVSDDGSVRRLRRRDANAFLFEITNNRSASRISERYCLFSSIGVLLAASIPSRAGAENAHRSVGAPSGRQRARRFADGVQAQLRSCAVHRRVRDRSIESSHNGGLDGPLSGHRFLKRY